MNELVYKIMFAIIVISSILIRRHYEKRYKHTHMVKESEIAPKREKLLTQIMFVCLAVPGTIWIFTYWLSFGQFALPNSVRIVGLVVGIYSMWWFYRIHKRLGDNWSPVLEIRKEHMLIIDGPYKWVRHPMYSDMLLWSMSFVLITANWLYAITLATGLTILFSFRIPDEERLMIERFGEQYRVYMKRTKRLIPYIF